VFFLYHREQQILDKWQHLIDLLEKKRKILHGFNDLLNMFREIESIGVEMKEMEVGFLLKDFIIGFDCNSYSHFVKDFNKM